VPSAAARQAADLAHRSGRPAQTVEHATFDFSGCEPPIRPTDHLGRDRRYFQVRREQTDRGVDVCHIRAELPELLFETGDMARELGSFVDQRRNDMGSRHHFYADGPPHQEGGTHPPVYSRTNAGRGGQSAVRRDTGAVYVAGLRSDRRRQFGTHVTARISLNSRGSFA